MARHVNVTIVDPSFVPMLLGKFSDDTLARRWLWLSLRLFLILDLNSTTVYVSKFKAVNASLGGIQELGKLIHLGLMTLKSGLFGIPYFSFKSTLESLSYDSDDMSNTTS